MINEIHFSKEKLCFGLQDIPHKSNNKNKDMKSKLHKLSNANCSEQNIHVRKWQENRLEMSSKPVVESLGSNTKQAACKFVDNEEALKVWSMSGLK